MSDPVSKVQGTSTDFGALPRFEPEPASRFNFSSALDAVGRIAGKAASAVTGVSFDSVGQQAALNELVDKQIAVQQMMLEVSFRSNVEKAKHDMEMAPVRNIRVS